MKKEKRIQEGVMHVYFRANGRYTVFYDDEDNLELLRRINKFAKKFGSRIYEFALMGNHAHFLIETGGVTELMRETLKSYSRWYNIKYKHSNKIFATPFSSACKKTEDWILETSAYILQNPVKAGMCSRAEYYRWSSCAFHFMEEKKRIFVGKAHIKLLCETIEVDTTVIDKYFKGYDDFLEFANYNPVLLSRIVPVESKWESCTMERLTKEVNKVLSGRMVNNLSMEEIAELIVEIKNRTNCKMMQLASILHADYKFVKECLQKRGQDSMAPQPE